jgi:hypothetical protein
MAMVVAAGGFYDETALAFGVSIK